MLGSSIRGGRLGSPRFLAGCCTDTALRGMLPVFPLRGSPATSATVWLYPSSSSFFFSTFCSTTRSASLSSFHPMNNSNNKPSTATPPLRLFSTTTSAPSATPYSTTATATTASTTVPQEQAALQMNREELLMHSKSLIRQRRWKEVHELLFSSSSFSSSTDRGVLIHMLAYLGYSFRPHFGLAAARGYLALSLRLLDELRQQPPSPYHPSYYPSSSPSYSSPTISVELMNRLLGVACRARDIQGATDVFAKGVKLGAHPDEYSFACLGKTLIRANNMQAAMMRDNTSSPKKREPRDHMRQDYLLNQKQSSLRRQAKQQQGHREPGEVDEGYQQHMALPEEEQKVIMEEGYDDQHKYLLANDDEAEEDQNEPNDTKEEQQQGGEKKWTVEDQQKEMKDLTLIVEEARRNGVRLTAVPFNAFLVALSLRPNAMNCVQQVLQLMERMGVTPDNGTWSRLLQVIVNQEKDLRKAFDFVAEVAKAHRATTSLFNQLLRLCAALKKTDAAFFVMDRMMEHKLEPDTFTYTLLMAACSKTADLERAYQLLEMMRERAVRGNVVLYNSLLTTMLKAHRAEDAMRLLHDMRTDEHLPRPDIVTYNALLALCLQNHSIAQTCLPIVFNCMVADRMQPDMDTKRSLQKFFKFYGERAMGRKYHWLKAHWRIKAAS
ncbi:hypothetical protein QOT17_006434 [Balamuthia mandrillaris]